MMKTTELEISRVVRSATASQQNCNLATESLMNYLAALTTKKSKEATIKYYSRHLQCLVQCDWGDGNLVDINEYELGSSIVLVVWIGRDMYPLVGVDENGRADWISIQEARNLRSEFVNR